MVVSKYHPLSNFTGTKGGMPVTLGKERSDNQRSTLTPTTDKNVPDFWPLSRVESPSITL